MDFQTSEGLSGLVKRSCGGRFSGTMCLFLSVAVPKQAQLIAGEAAQWSHPKRSMCRIASIEIVGQINLDLFPRS